MMGASRTFSVSTVSTYDGMHPRHFSLLRHGGLAAVAVLLQCIEALGAWPRQVAMVMTVLLPKPKGGWRGIGLFPGLHRLYTRVRQPYFQLWEARNWRPYFAAAAGRGPEQVVWRQAMVAEAASTTGTSCTASVLWDLRKFFEHLDLSLLEGRGLRAGFDAVVLRAVISAYRFARVISGRAGMTVPAWARSGVTPGCGAAAVMIKVYCMEPFDQLVARLSALSLKVTLDVYFDDLHLSVQGDDQASATKVLTKAAVELSVTVRQDLRCTVAPDKGGIVASCSKLLARVAKAMAKLPGSAMKTCANLGVDFTAGRCHRAAPAHTMQSRLSTYVKRSRKISVLQRASAGRLAHKISLCGGRPSLQYGASCYGLSGGQLRDRRRALAQTLRPTAKGRSLDAVCLLHGDPMAAGAVAPASAWCAEVWNSLCTGHWPGTAAIPMPELRQAWETCAGGSIKSWRWARGPISATVMTLRRLGWSFTGPFDWIDHDGVPLQLTRLAPAMMLSKWRWHTRGSWSYRRLPRSVQA